MAGEGLDRVSAERLHPFAKDIVVNAWEDENPITGNTSRFLPQAIIQ